jgi:hypothetical protein
VDHHTDPDPDPQLDWRAALAGFGAMVAALDDNPAEARAALMRFGCSPHLIHAIYVAYVAGER